MTIAQIADELGLERYDRRAVKAVLEEKVEARHLQRVGKTRYRWEPREVRPGGGKAGTDGGRVRPRGGGIEGRYSRARAGFGFVEVQGDAARRFQRDVFIPAGMEGAALHGDRVEIEIDSLDARDRRASGRVVRVVAAARERIIGTLQSYLRGWRLLPSDELLPIVDIVGGESPRARDAGLVAVVRLTAPPTPGRPARGSLERVLGAADDPEVQFLTIALEFGLRVDFPDDVLAAAAALPTDPRPDDFAGREDLRAMPFVTIDGEDARDFDDAVCVERRGAGWRAWVAIADVAHYVQRGSPLDVEAALRGTSTYFPDRAVPMLPERLSNQLCSLNPERERLVLVAEMDLDAAARRTDQRFYRAVIRSRARLTYTRVAAELAAADGAPRSADPIGDPVIEAALRDMRALMRGLYENRMRAGALDLDLPEPIVQLSADGHCVGLGLRERNDAHRIIEELMLEANRAVAIHLRDRDVSFPYRIHEPPDPEELVELNEVLARFGLRVAIDDPVRPRDVQAVLDKLRGHPMEAVLSRRMLRSLTQARYSAINSGHFGLAFPIYCHFTSPIRRYPDLLVHRQLGRLFDGDVRPAAAEMEAIEAASAAASQCERNSMDAERAMLDLRRAEFMLQHLGEPHPGFVVGVASFGFFVELDAYPVEGLVRIQDVADDYYEFVEAESVLQGARTNRIIGLGDRVVVEAVDVSLQRRRIELALLEHRENETLRGRLGGRGAPPARRDARRGAGGRGRRR